MKKGAKRRALSTCFALFLMLALCSNSKAATHVDLVSATPAGGGLTVFVYSWTVESGTLSEANYFTIYDILGLDHVTVPPGWGYDLPIVNIGQTPSGVSPQDDPNIPNVTFRYYPNPRVDNPAPITISGFDIFSTNSLTQTGVYATRNSTGPGFLDVTGSVLVPAVGTAVPEPSTTFLLVLGLFGLVGYGKMRIFTR